MTSHAASFAPYLFALHLAVALVAAPAVRAQEEAGVADVIVLTDGSFVRGTLVEYAAGEYAVLLTRGGQLRRFEARDMRYAGPAKSMPRAPTDPAPPAPAQPLPATSGATEDTAVAADSAAHVRFESNEPVDVLRRSGVSTSLAGATTGESYTPVCTAPCTSALDPGAYTLSLALPGHAPVRAGTVELSRGSIVEARYESRFGLRVGGLIVGLGSTTLGLGLMLSDVDDIGGTFWAGCAVGAIGAIVGSVLALASPDSAHVRVVR